MRIILKNQNKKNQRIIDRLQRKNIVKNLEHSKIKSQLKKNLDNYPVHKAQLTKACEILNIQLITSAPIFSKTKSHRTSLKNNKA